jgi:hypothetical protein
VTDYNPLLQQLAARRYLNQDNLPCGSPLIDETNREEFLAVASETLEQAELSEVLLRAISFYLGSGASELEISFVSLYAALETILTFFRRQNEYEILGAEEFDELERDLRNWLRQHPLVASDSVKRGLIYEKIRELNRFPFSHVFKRFCEHYSLDLTDLWPVLRTGEPWPLMEIRHRLVHGDPFQSRPVEALACARVHLAWVVERMLLCALGWTVSRSNVSYEYLQGNCIEHQAWQAERAKFA